MLWTYSDENVFVIATHFYFLAHNCFLVFPQTYQVALQSIGLVAGGGGTCTLYVFVGMKI